MNLLIAWILLTPVFVIVFLAFLPNSKVQKLEGNVLWFLIAIVTMFWWGLYFLRISL